MQLTSLSGLVEVWDGEALNICQSGAFIACAWTDQEQDIARVAAKLQMHPAPQDFYLPLCSIGLFVWLVSLVLNC